MSQTFARAMAAFKPSLPLAVALSGGADSTALLLACAEKWPGQVRAIHVHHGLQDAADGFERHCMALCGRLNMPLVVRRVDARHARGESPENAARTARYEVISNVPSVEWSELAINSIAVAQHADDQVETVLLALSRGAGLPGLAAMPEHWQRNGLTWHRPLLAVPGPAIRDWLRERHEAWVEDPTNVDEGFTRNRIRAQLLPALAAAFPQFRDTFARSAAHAAEAQTVLNEVAAQDLAGLGVPPLILRLQALSRARQANALRHWLRSVHATTPSTAQLAELLDQIAACTTRGHRMGLKVGAGFVVRQGEAIDWQPA
jgi:tRNA(Ile)-lysidine synthase